MIVRYYIGKNKPWRDDPDEYRFRSAEFPDGFDTLEEARKAIRERHNDGAKCIVLRTVIRDGEKLA